MIRFTNTTAGTIDNTKSTAERKEVFTMNAINVNFDKPLFIASEFETLLKPLPMSKVPFEEYDSFLKDMFTERTDYLDYGSIATDLECQYMDMMDDVKYFDDVTDGFADDVRRTMWHGLQERIEFYNDKMMYVMQTIGILQTRSKLYDSFGIMDW